MKLDKFYCSCTFSTIELANFDGRIDCKHYTGFGHWSIGMDVLNDFLML